MRFREVRDGTQGVMSRRARWTLLRKASSMIAGFLGSPLSLALANGICTVSSFAQLDADL
jgi:hypothetical protein